MKNPFGRGTVWLIFILFVGVNLHGSESPQKASTAQGFPKTVRVRLYALHPPTQLLVRADSSRGARAFKLRRCPSCKDTEITTLNARASGAQIVIDTGKLRRENIRLSGAYKVEADAGRSFAADFPIDVKAQNGHLLITAVMPMDEYIAGVLAGETANFKSEEALKAMAVAARTYAIHFGSRHAVDGFDFCDSTHCQSLRLAAADPKMMRIVESTSGEILWYEGEPAATYYHANCGGTTEDGRFILASDEPHQPFLRQHSDQYCVRDGEMKWRTEVSKAELQRALLADGIVVPGKLQRVEVVSRTPSGRTEVVRISGSSSITVPALAFRFAIGRHIGWDRLKSNWYEVSQSGDTIWFQGRGSGHGVGLCQVGAEVMGEEGHSYREILSFYYPGTRLGVSAQGVPWQQLANQDVTLLTLNPDRDRMLLPMASQMAHQAEDQTGLVYRSNLRLKVYATVAAFRDSTGEPGWVAATTSGRTIQLQPPDVLREKNALESTLRHELLHMLIESYALPGTPLWFREGLVLYLGNPNATVDAGTGFMSTAALEKALRVPASEEQLRVAYRDARARVAQLIAVHGKDAVIGWVLNGMPAELKTAQSQGQ